jgi:hypothetical protein
MTTQENVAEMPVADQSDPEWTEEPEWSLSRPFLERGAKVAGRDVGSEADINVGIRPYFVTGGRTRSRNRTVSFETIVALREDSPPLDTVDDERRMVATRAAIPHSMAELSALLHLPIGVVWVLAGDLADDGYLTVYAPPADVLDDVELIDSLIDGLRRL